MYCCSERDQNWQSSTGKRLELLIANYMRPYSVNGVKAVARCATFLGFEELKHRSWFLGDIGSYVSCNELSEWSFVAGESWRRAYMPNVIARLPVKPSRLSDSDDEQQEQDTEDDELVIPSLGLVATRPLENQEILLNYRLSTHVESPSWYTPVDKAEDKRRWSWPVNAFHCVSWLSCLSRFASTAKLGMWEKLQLTSIANGFEREFTNAWSLLLRTEDSRASWKIWPVPGFLEIWFLLGVGVLPMRTLKSRDVWKSMNRRLEIFAELYFWIQTKHLAFWELWSPCCYQKLDPNPEALNLQSAELQSAETLFSSRMHSWAANNYLQ